MQRQGMNISTCYLPLPLGHITTHYDRFFVLILGKIYLMSTFLARGRQEDSPDWLRYRSGKGAGFL